MLWSLVRRVDLLSGARGIGSVVTADDARVCTRFAGTVRPSRRSSRSNLETADSAFAQDPGCWVGSHEAGEGKEQSMAQQHHRGNVRVVRGGSEDRSLLRASFD
jgi:hypothetical protein